MKNRFTLPFCVLLACLLIPITADAAERFDTHHNISVRLGYHNFFPDTSDHEGTRPNDDGVVTEEEWQYIWESGYRIQDYDGLTFEIGYEYFFVFWLGLGLDLGYYGNQKEFNFKVSGYQTKSKSKIEVWHLDLTPRIHWNTRWTNLYGGPVIGYYIADMDFDIDMRFGDYKGSYNDKNHGDGFGLGLMIGFEFRIIKNFGVAIEDRLLITIIDEFADEEGGGPNMGGNVLTLTGIAHF